MTAGRLAARMRRGRSCAGCYTRRVARVYVAVLVVEAAVLAALWLVSRHFAV